MASGNKELLSSIESDMALESPQILTNWSYEDNLPELINFKLQRSTYRYPEDDTEGDNVLDEVADNTNLRTSVSDTSPAADLVHYYSLFFDYKGPFSTDLNYYKDIERLGVLKGVSLNPTYLYVGDDLGVGNNIITVFAGTFANIPIAPYSIYIAVIDAVFQSVADDGKGGWVGHAVAGSINYTTGVYSVTFTGAPDLGTRVVAMYGYGNEDFSILAKDNDLDSVLWGYNKKTGLCDTKLILTNLLNTNEHFVSMIYFIKLGFYGAGSDGVTAGAGIFNSTIATFLTVGVLPGDYLWVLNGLDIGTYIVDTVISENQIKLTTNFPNQPEVALKYIIFGPSSSTKLVTNKRVISVSARATVTTFLTSHIVAANTWNLDGRLDPGYEVTGSCLEYIALGTPHTLGVRILDAYNKNAKLFTETGTLLREMDLTGLSDNDLLRGLSTYPPNDLTLIGNDKIIYGVTTTDVAPTNANIDEIIPVRDRIVINFVQSNEELFTLLTRFGVLESYVYTDLDNKWEIEERTPLGTGVQGLWRLEESSGTTVTDQTDNGYDGTSSGSITLEATGKFDYCYQFTALDGQISIPMGASFIAATGYVSLWWKIPYSGYLPPTANRDLFYLAVDANNIISLELNSSDQLEVVYMKGGVLGGFTVATPAAVKDGIFHHFLVCWEHATTSIKLYVDGVLAGSDLAIVGAWAGVPTLLIGKNGSSALGYYDDIVFGDDVKTFFTRYSLTTQGNRSHALSGRDYSDSSFKFRDNLRKKFFSEHILKNDYDAQLISPDKALSDGEVIFRYDPAIATEVSNMVLGHLGRTTRMFGLMLDRFVDKRKHFMNHLTASQVEDEFIQGLGELILANEVDTRWNVEVKRRFLEVMFYCYQRVGSLDAFRRMVRFLGFRLWAPLDVFPVSVSRRWLDSVVDPTRPDQPLDTGIFDSSALDYQMVTLLFTFFKENISGVNGVTSIPGNRQFDSAGATFLTTVEVGSMLKIYDNTTTDDNGEYLVTAINSDTQIEVERDWLVGSLANLSYHLHWQVPEVDPYVAQINGRLKQLKVKWQKIDYQEAS